MPSYEITKLLGWNSSDTGHVLEAIIHFDNILAGKVPNAVVDILFVVCFEGFAETMSSSRNSII